MMRQKGGSLAPFLVKTYGVVEDPATDGVVSWNGDGTGFVVWQPAEFARDVLPTLFKHSNFSSFVRQLNTYGFRKVTTSRWEFRNDMFRKGGKELLSEIRRRKTWAHNKAQQGSQTLAATKESDEDPRSSSTSSSSEYVSLVDENRRLKEENGALSSELSSMRRRCKELLDLVATHAKSREEEEEEEEEEEGPKLFGVRLEVKGERERKRKREETSPSAWVLLSQSCK